MSEDGKRVDSREDGLKDFPETESGEAYLNWYKQNDFGKRRDVAWWRGAQWAWKRAKANQESPPKELSDEEILEYSDDYVDHFASLFGRDFDHTKARFFIQDFLVWQRSKAKAEPKKTAEQRTESPPSSADLNEREKTLIEALNKIDYLMRPYRFSEMPYYVWWEIYRIAADTPKLNVTAEQRTESPLNSAIAVELAKYKKAIAIARKHLEEIRSGLTTDINKTEFYTKRLAHETLVEIDATLASSINLQSETSSEGRENEKPVD